MRPGTELLWHEWDSIHRRLTRSIRPGGLHSLTLSNPLDVRRRTEVVNGTAANRLSITVSVDLDHTNPHPDAD
ncbi:hypothetical protein BKH31_00725 [Actinomyces oris]|uniref:Uncharacterized protein n=1 Tax=Actinomyces oris TaxID=544580 RepID=A0A1Q8VLV8_9ACTO|nr:hypothetical protein [Actinomyces oris]OLO49045.1 hypothetical protein BKH31_00725 [Actinomyces oris]